MKPQNGDVKQQALTKRVDVNFLQPQYALLS